MSMQETLSHCSLQTSTLASLLSACMYVSQGGCGGGMYVAIESDPHIFVINTWQIERNLFKGYLLSFQHPWGAVLGTIITGNIFASASFLTAGWEAQGVGHGNHSSFSWAIVTLMRSILIAIRTLCSRWSHMERGHLELGAEKGLLSIQLCTCIF